VVPTLNRSEVLLDCLGDLLQQSHRPLEILIVDQSDHPSQELERLVVQHSEIIQWCRVGFRGLPAARNFGWRHAEHKAIVFVDDDIRCGPSLMTEHLRALQLPNVGVVAGGIEEARGERGISRWVGRFNHWTATPEHTFSAFMEGEVDHAPGCNFSTWYDVLDRTGGFDETLQVGAALYEETDFCLRAQRAGYRIYFNGRARLTHLAVGGGGCRVRDISAYVYGLAHNRGLIMRRHLAWFHLPTAALRLGMLCVSYATHYRTPVAVIFGLKGAVAGWRAAGRPSLCR
jgi:GT2 family glycosyltransferase